MTHKKVLNELCSQISALADIKTGSGHSSNVMAKVIAAVRVVEAFKLAYRNPPRELQVLNSVVRACTFEADRAALRSCPEYGRKPQGYDTRALLPQQQRSYFILFW